NSSVQRLTPVQVNGLSTVTAIAAGYRHTVALKDDGTVWAWGDNSGGQLGDNSTTQQLTPVQVTGITNVTTVAAGSFFTLAVKNDNTAWAWGSNASGQLGDDSTTNRLTPTQVSGLTNGIAITAGAGHTMALKSDGTVWAWGSPDNGQLGYDNTQKMPLQSLINLDATPPQTIADTPGGSYGSSQTVQLSCSDTLSGCAGTWYTTDGSDPTTASTLYTGAIGIGQTTTLKYFSRDSAGNSEAIQSQTYTLPVQYSLALTVTGNGAVTSTPLPDMACTGACSRPYDQGTIVTLVPRAASGSYFGGWSGCDSVAGAVCSVTMASAKSVTASFAAYPSGAVAIAAGKDHSVELKTDGTVWAWGDSSSGQLGNGGTAQRNSPVQTSGLASVSAVAAGSFHTLALQNDGTIRAWGYNGNGRLGDGTVAAKTTPVQVIGITNATAIAAGGNYLSTPSGHSLALLADGTVMAWGSNNVGQLGNGLTADSLVPVTVPGLNSVVAIAAGADHSMALKNDGTVWAWGAEENGRLGNNVTTGTARRTPVQVTIDATNTPLTGVIAIACGGTHSLALRRDGTVWAWGANGSGQLGTGLTGQSAFATQVLTPGGGALNGIAAIAAGGWHSLALDGSGSVLAWGDNYDGQVGDNYASSKELLPVPVLNLSGVTALAAGERHSLALMADGTLWSWGNNAKGQLGVNTTGKSGFPLQMNQDIPCNALLRGTCFGTI
ncbi:MAG TPA: chitobiase/beta-hexosaminidase C-terminal domain-containing protein, partial [Geobacteraceae bacterium]